MVNATFNKHHSYIRNYIHFVYVTVLETLQDYFKGNLVISGMRLAVTATLLKKLCHNKQRSPEGCWVKNQVYFSENNAGVKINLNKTTFVLTKTAM